MLHSWKSMHFGICTTLCTTPQVHICAYLCPDILAVWFWVGVLTSQSLFLFLQNGDYSTSLMTLYLMHPVQYQAHNRKHDFTTQASGAIIFPYPAGILDGLARIFPHLPTSGMVIFPVLSCWAFVLGEGRQPGSLKNVWDGTSAAPPTHQCFWRMWAKVKPDEGRGLVAGNQAAISCEFSCWEGDLSKPKVCSGANLGAWQNPYETVDFPIDQDP